MMMENSEAFMMTALKSENLISMKPTAESWRSIQLASVAHLIWRPDQEGICDGHRAWCGNGDAL
jgi:hypothetical protein